jgi:peptidoglycan/xylan/chitin deacetylase (PgdA/CDA1 family)
MVRARAGTAIAVACVLLAGCGAGTSLRGGAAPQTAPPGSRAVASSTASSPTPSGDECTVPESLAGRDVTRLPVKKKLVALTFDAGANADGVPSIRATLGRTKVKATFFLTGRFVQSYPVKSKRLARRDLVGNHTMTHARLTKLSDAKVTAQVRDAQAVITSTTGQDPRRFFRFPFGAANPHLVGLLNDLCYVPFRWTVDSLGWQGTSGGQSVASVVARVVAAAKPGAIVLMHVGSNPDDHTTLDADALPTIIKKLRGQGYSFVRLSRVMSAAP